jgi:sugar lactone lactonase YvrE
MRTLNLDEGTIRSLRIRALESSVGIKFRHPEPVSAALMNEHTLVLAYLSDSIVARLDIRSGVITPLAGTGTAGYSGDGGSAVAAELNFPISAVADATGNIFIADANNNVVRRIEAESHVIATIAGTGKPGYAGDGCPASEAHLGEVSALALNGRQDLYLADLENCAIRRLDAVTGVITTVAGTGRPGYSGDGGPAAASELNYPAGIAFDRHGNLFIADTSNSVVRRIDAASGIIATVVGSGIAGYAGDSGIAIEAQLNEPCGLAVDDGDNLLIADYRNCVIRRVDAETGVITTIAGNGQPGHAGDGGPAVVAELDHPLDLAVANHILFVTEALRRFRGGWSAPTA